MKRATPYDASVADVPARTCSVRVAPVYLPTAKNVAVPTARQEPSAIPKRIMSNGRGFTGVPLPLPVPPVRGVEASQGARLCMD